MRTRWLVVLCLGAASSLGACNADTSADDSSSAALSTDGGMRAADSAFSTPNAARALVALSGDGLMLVDPSTGSTRAITFGTDETFVIDALTRALGAPGEREPNFDCGMGPLQFVEFRKGGLTIAVQEGKFLGWSIHHNGESLRTLSNIGVMSTRAELESAYSTEIAPSSLGIEFMAGGLQGVLTSTADTARISDFWAGANCVAR